MFDDPRGPIQHFSWGAFVIGDEEHSTEAGVGKDIRLVGEDVSPWRERKGHKLKKSMITGVYDRDVEVLVIGIGVHGAVKCPDKVKKAIREHGISELILQPTPQACATYNDLFHQDKEVALLAHGTC
ncbi:MAG: Mth938-like domain-containing protein [Anaerolineae bacterium]